MLTMTEEKEAPRLYTRQPRGPVDEIAPQHVGIHDELETFGRWCREKLRAGTCESVEKNFDPGEGGRKVRLPTITLPENPRLRQLDRVLRHMQMDLPQHGEALKMYYVGRLPPQERACHWCGREMSWPCRNQVDSVACGGKKPPPPFQYVRAKPNVICRELHLHWSNFENLMFDARCAVVNLLRRQGA